MWICLIYLSSVLSPVILNLSSFYPRLVFYIYFSTSKRTVSHMWNCPHRFSSWRLPFWHHQHYTIFVGIDKHLFTPNITQAVDQRNSSSRSGLVNRGFCWGGLDTCVTQRPLYHQKANPGMNSHSSKLCRVSGLNLMRL